MRELTDADVTALPAAGLVTEVAAALADLGRGDATQGTTQRLPGPGGGFFLSLSASLPRRGVAVAKWVSYCPGRPGVPGASSSTVLVSSTVTGEVRAVLTGTGATRLRTAASAAAVVAALHDGPRSLALVGFGETNRALVALLAATGALPQDVRVLVRSEASAAAAAAHLRDAGVAGARAGTSPDLVAGADLAVSATGAATAVADVATLAPGGVALALDGARTWHGAADVPVLDDHVRPGAVPSLARFLAGDVARPDGRVLVDMEGSAVTDAALAALLLDAAPGEGATA